MIKSNRPPSGYPLLQMPVIESGPLPDYTQQETNIQDLSWSKWLHRGFSYSNFNMPPRYPHQSETGPWEDGCVSPYKTVYKSYCPRYGGSMVIISSINFNYALTRLDRRATLWDVQALGKSHLPLPTTVRFRELGLGGRLTFLHLGQLFFVLVLKMPWYIPYLVLG